MPLYGPCQWSTSRGTEDVDDSRMNAARQTGFFIHPFHKEQLQSKIVHLLSCQKPFCFFPAVVSPKANTAAIYPIFHTDILDVESLGPLVLFLIWFMRKAWSVSSRTSGLLDSTKQPVWFSSPKNP